MRVLNYFIFYSYFVLVCQCSAIAQQNSETVNSIKIELFIDSCVSIDSLTKYRIIVSNNSSRPFHFNILNLHYGVVRDKLGNDIERIAIIEPIIKSEKRKYTIGSGSKEEIKISESFLCQYLYSDGSTYFLKNVYYQDGNQRKRKNKNPKIFLSPIEFTACHSR